MGNWSLWVRVCLCVCFSPGHLGSLWNLKFCHRIFLSQYLFKKNKLGFIFFFFPDWGTLVTFLPYQTKPNQTQKETNKKTTHKNLGEEGRRKSRSFCKCKCHIHLCLKTQCLCGSRRFLFLFFAEQMWILTFIFGLHIEACACLRPSSPNLLFLFIYLFDFYRLLCGKNLWSVSWPAEMFVCGLKSWIFRAPVWLS